MQSITFECEVVTPMFLGGADQQAELRPPSIRGAMRWWFRAMMGGGLFDVSSNLTNDVKEIEAQIFGDTNASGVFSISIIHNLKDTDYSAFDFDKHSIRYIGYGLYGKENSRSYIKPRSRFEIILRLRTDNIKYRNFILGSLWMLGNFGNLGSRASRGFGAFNIKCRDKTFEQIFPVAKKMNDLQSAFQNIANVYFNIPKSSVKKSMAPFSIVHPNAWDSVLLNNSEQNPIALLENIGAKLREFREDPSFPSSKSIQGKTVNHTREYKNIILSKPVSKKNGLASLPSTSIFGLPHPFKVLNNTKVTIEAENRDRRTSPLHIHVHKFDDAYYLSLQKFECLFVDGNMKYYEPGNKSNNEIVVGNPSFKEIDVFFTKVGKTTRIAL